MTIVFSAATSKFIVMTTDSAIIDTDLPQEGETAEKRTSRREPKSCGIPGVGCVGIWGKMDGNRIRYELRHKYHPKDRDEKGTRDHKVEELALLVQNYLTEDFQPRERGAEDVGYHIAGFDHEGKACLFHCFWGVPRPNPYQLQQDYRWCDHSPTEAYPLSLVYNGRNDIAEKTINILLQEIRVGGNSRFNLNSEIDLARLGDFVARIAGELTYDVDLPFRTHVIYRDRIVAFENNVFAPIDPNKIQDRLKDSRSNTESMFVQPSDATPELHVESDIYRYELKRYVTPVDVVQRIDDSPAPTGGTVTSVPSAHSN